MLVSAPLNLVALLIRSVLSGAFVPPAPDAAGTFSATSGPRWSCGQNTPRGSRCVGDARSPTESTEIDVWLTSHGRSEDSNYELWHFRPSGLRSETVWQVMCSCDRNIQKLLVKVTLNLEKALKQVDLPLRILLWAKFWTNLDTWSARLSLFVILKGVIFVLLAYYLTVFSFKSCIIM